MKGVSFIDRTINAGLPMDMLGRNLFEATEIKKLYLEEIPGSIFVTIDREGKKVKEVPFPTGDYKPSVELIKKNDAFYHSVVDSTAGAQGSYLQLITADLTVKMKAEVTVKENAVAHIPKEKIPWNELAQWARTHPKEFPEQQRFYVRTALLANVAKTIFHEVSANAQVNGGMAFGAGGKIYATDASTVTMNLAYIGVDLLHVDDVQDISPGKVPLYGDYRIIRNRIFEEVYWSKKPN